MRVVLCFLRSLLALSLVMAVSACDHTPSPSSQTESSQQAQTQPKQSFGRAVEPGVALQFPKDHGAHPDYGLEWWYLTANVVDQQQQTHGVQFTLFRFRGPQQHQSNWWQGQWFMAHAMWEHQSDHVAVERFGRGVGQSGVTAAPFAAWLDDWVLASKGASFLPLQLSVATNEFSFELELDDSPRVLHGDQGYSDKSGDGVLASYYYSYPRLSVAGEINTDDRRYQVSGTGWFDREWSSALLDERYSGWDWFGLTLDDGSSLMLFCLNGLDSALSHCDGSRHRGDGTLVNLEDRFTMEPLQTTKNDGVIYPLQWRIKVANEGIDIMVTTDSSDQLNRLSTRYWEGPVTVEGSHQGYGFIEMTGRHQ